MRIADPVDPSEKHAYSTYRSRDSKMTVVYLRHELGECGDARVCFKRNGDSYQVTDLEHWNEPKILEAIQEKRIVRMDA